MFQTSMTGNRTGSSLVVALLGLTLMLWVSAFGIPRCHEFLHLSRTAREH